MGITQHEYKQQQQTTFAKELGKAAQNIFEEPMKPEKVESETPRWLLEKKRQKKQSKGLHL